MKCLSPFGILLAVLFAFGPARAEPALWVAHTPTATVYLFGTVHLLTGKTVWRSPRIDHASPPPAISGWKWRTQETRLHSSRSSGNTASIRRTRSRRG